MDGHYDVAQICLNGHLITEKYRSHPEKGRDYCERCGEKSISKCPSCQKDITGEFMWDNGMFAGQFQRHFPFFCDKCGQPFPWTIKKLQAIQEITKTIKLKKNEKELLLSSLDDLVKDTPDTPIAVIRWKKALSEAEATVKEAIREIFITILTETAKRLMFQ